MKRICLLLLLFLLCGCAAVQNTPTETRDEPVLTVEPWDSEGVLSELVLTIPGGFSYTDCMGFRNCLLLWSNDGHREGAQVMDLCLIDPAEQSMVAHRTVQMPNPVIPQVYGDSLYLCDPKTGTVVELDRRLEILGEWTVPAAASEDAVWYAANRKLWEFSSGQPLRCLTLGEIYWSEENAQWKNVRRPEWNVYQHYLNGGIVSFSCRSGEAQQIYALDLTEGTVINPPQGYEYYYRSGNVWLGFRYDEGFRYGICVGGGAMRKISPRDGTLILLQEGYLLEKSPGDQDLRLYDREGRCISVCRLWETMDGYAERLIWNDSLGGYLIHYRPHSGGRRLLFWDIEKGTGIGRDLKLRNVPSDANVPDALRAEANALAERFGITISVGTDCDLEQAAPYTDESCTYAADFDQVCDALDRLEQALEQYPEDFFRQMQGQFLHQIRFQFLSNYETAEGKTSGTVLIPEESALLTFDADRMRADTVWHEVGHLVDAYLKWCDAGYSSEGWDALNPDWFKGYTCVEPQTLPAQDEHFISSRATCSPEEDFAQVMEYAMSAKGARVFREKDGVRGKLEYLSQCIREAFDTASWEQLPLWEQYLTNE